VTDPRVNISFDKDHLKPLERAARILCAMNNDDPDQQVPCAHPLGLEVPFSEPLWHHAAGALLELNRMLVALKMAHAQELAEQNVKVAH
jgi:hypothetical protein